jgi:hypothetical protein
MPFVQHATCQERSAREVLKGILFAAKLYMYAAYKLGKSGSEIVLGRKLRRKCSLT